MASRLARTIGLTVMVLLGILLAVHPVEGAALDPAESIDADGSDGVLDDAADELIADDGTDGEHGDQSVELVQASLQAAGAARGDLTPNQLTAGRSLTWEEALAACGPAAAAGLARARGREVTLDAAVSLARKVGWTTAKGMAGPGSMVALLERIGVPVTLEVGVDRAKVVREVQAGRPVVIRMVGGRGHYLVAERYDPSTGRFDFAQTALVVKRSGGKRWWALDEIGSLGVGTPTQAIYLAGATRPPPAPPYLSTSSAGPTSAETTGRSWVVDTGSRRARLRARPSLQAPILAAVPNGARVVDLGTEATADGLVWRRVRAPTGSLGWIAATLLVPA